jgi:hypothetical protein
VDYTGICPADLLLVISDEPVCCEEGLALHKTHIMLYYLFGSDRRLADEVVQHVETPDQDVYDISKMSL